MRYFKYRNPNKSRNRALKEQYKTLSASEKKVFRKANCLRNIGNILVYIIFCALVVGSFALLKLIPQPQAGAWRILAFVGKVILALLLLVLSGIVTAVLTLPLWKKAETYELPRMQKELIAKACSPLRSYYGLQEPYTLTKCFHATDERFRNRDVCIFVVGEELRLTTDLAHGFLNGERDLGCYAFKKEELTLLKRQEENRLLLELVAHDTTFLLGYRAKTFIEKHFVPKQKKSN